MKPLAGANRSKRRSGVIKSHERDPDEAARLERVGEMLLGRRAQFAERDRVAPSRKGALSEIWSPPSDEEPACSYCLDEAMLIGENPAGEMVTIECLQCVAGQSRAVHRLLKRRRVRGTEQAAAMIASAKPLQAKKFREGKLRRIE